MSLVGSNAAVNLGALRLSHVEFFAYEGQRASGDQGMFYGAEVVAYARSENRGLASHGEWRCTLAVPVMSVHLQHVVERAAFEAAERFGVEVLDTTEWPRRIY